MLPLIPLLLGGVATIAGIIVAPSIFKKSDDYSPCVKDMIKAGLTPEKAAEKCYAKPTPSIAETSLTPILILAGVAIAGPPLVRAITKTEKEKK